MNTQNNQPIKIDFLKLSDSEKAKLIKRTKEAIRKRIEEAKFWCPLPKPDGIVVNGQPVGL